MLVLVFSICVSLGLHYNSEGKIVLVTSHYCIYLIAAVTSHSAHSDLIYKTWDLLIKYDAMLDETIKQYIK